MKPSFFLTVLTLVMDVGESSLWLQVLLETRLLNTYCEMSFLAKSLRNRATHWSASLMISTGISSSVHRELGGKAASHAMSSTFDNILVLSGCEVSLRFS